MSIQYKAAIVVGATWNSVPIDDEVFDNIKHLVDDGELDDFPPCYDGGQEGVFGYELEKTPDYYYSEINAIAFNDKVAALKQQFLAMTGFEAKVYLTPVGY
jgi:hypothetical protein